MAIDITLKRGSNRRHIAVVGPYQFWNLAGHSLWGSPTPKNRKCALIGAILLPGNGSHIHCSLILPHSELLTLHSERSLLLHKKCLMKLSFSAYLLPIESWESRGLFSFWILSAPLIPLVQLHLKFLAFSMNLICVIPCPKKLHHHNSF